MYGDGAIAVDMPLMSLAKDLRSEACRLGFQDLGVCVPKGSEQLEFYRRWIKLGYHGDMAYLERPDSVIRRGDLRLTMEDVRAVIVVSQAYFQPDSPGIPADPARGVVARYARGEDYHDLVKNRLQDLLRWLRTEARKRRLGGEVRGFPYVDTGPILERELGVRAGLGWFGKNTMLLHPRRGSYFFLGVLLTNLPLPADPPFSVDRCGSCRACIEACPTGALLGRDEDGAPVMDARRCISYLTIELKGPIPRDFRSAMGNRIFGCDICQEVCPWNRRFAEVASEPGYRSRRDTDGPALMDLMGLSDEEFRARFSGSPVKRAKRRGFLRNVAVALGNWGSQDAVPVLTEALDDPEPLVRGHAAWALGRILEKVGIPGDGGFEVAEALLFRLHIEEDPWVEEELEEALRGER
ncbi:MAG: tRNA epoxyqueuosine(34) reductase QueG [Gemmatimonadota bacterium]